MKQKIDGVVVWNSPPISDYRGKIMKMVDKFNPLLFTSFGEIYFSLVHPGIVKGWHRHKEMEMNYACIYGKIQLVLIDTRETSPTHKMVMEICISPDNYKIIHIPPLVLNGFKGLGTTDSIVANLSSVPHSEKEIERFPLDWFDYDWFKKGQ